MWRFGWKGDSGEEWKRIIGGDGRGYYAYIDQLFIKGNFGQAPIDYDLVHEADGHSVIKHPCGTALLLTPFFLASRGIAELSGMSVAASTELNLKMISIAALFYFLLGCYFIFRLLMRLMIKPSIAAGSILLFFAGTNLMLYVTTLPSLSHTYSFFAISCLLYAFKRFVDQPKLLTLFITGFLLGLVYLIRPFNLVILLFLPFFFSSPVALLQFIRQHILKLLLLAVIFLATASIQHFLWYRQCGHFFLWSYQHEGFYFLHPEISNFLFSFRKGLFIYTPLMMVPVAGSFVLLKKRLYPPIVFILFTMVLVYLLSAWWYWTFADGYGTRAIIDFYPVFILLSAMLWGAVKKVFRPFLLVFAAGCICLNGVQSYQVTRGILHPDYMNAQSYRYIFLKTSDQYADCIGGSFDLPLYNRYQKKLVASGIAPDLDWVIRNSNGIVSDMNLTVFDSLKSYGCNVTFRNDSALSQALRTWAVVEFDKLDSVSNASDGAKIVISVRSGNPADTYYHGMRLNYLPDGPAGQWQHIRYSLILPKIRANDYRLVFFVWNQERQQFCLRNFKVSIYGF